VELEWVTWLWIDIHSDNFKARPIVAHRCTAGSAEQIKQTGFTHQTTSPAPSPA
jgi:hypothetical protein